MSKKKPYKVPNRDAWVKARLRNASVAWPPANEALNLAKREYYIPSKTGKQQLRRVGFECAICKQLFKRNQVHRDHKEPVVDVQKGYTTLQEWIDRLLVDVNDYQILCEQDHENKTVLENEMRSYYKKKNKKKK